MKKITLYLCVLFMIIAGICFVISCCWSHTEFNYPLLLAVFSYVLSIIFFKMFLR